ncbi:TonB-dependent receptor [Sphingomonas immobilis]|uniref:TonB-dependent receptor n=1 Tax=Sphingomonas immobilis TaxID=3063997 RepID=A0ABT9A458_9SPHN|nr:TonB-dependent receptor [Sphingomonas sp. CA1-15]MDO7843517.1 TonB-dependent receptor [Sphingomonas sp. CA1-15]
MSIFTSKLRAIAKNGAISSFALAIGLLATPAHAQSGKPLTTVPDETTAENPAQSQALDDIVVTARRVNENLQDVPVAITAFSGAQLEAKNITSIADIGSVTPGFSIAPSPRSGTAFALSIRGQVQNDVLATVEPSIGTYVDEVYWARAYGLYAGLVDVANVQVLKGPQGTLFGRNTSGGAMLIQTNDAVLDEFSGRGTLTYGRFNERTAEGIINVPIGDRVALRGVVKYSARDGWARQVVQFNSAGVRDNRLIPDGVIRETGKRYSDKEEIQGRLKATVKISDATTFLASGEWYSYDTNGPSRQTAYKIQDNIVGVTPINAYIDYFKTHPDATGVDGHNCDAAVSTTSGPTCTSSLVQKFDTYTKLRTETYVAKLVTETFFGQAKLIGGYRRVKSNALLELDGSSSLLHTTEADIDLKQYSVEAQITGKAFHDFLDFAGGATYFRETGLDRTYSFSNSGGNPTATVSRQNALIENDSFGFYAQFGAHLTDKLTVTGGVRYSLDDKKIRLGTALATDRNTGIPLACAIGNTVANDCLVPNQATFNAISWMASVDYKFSDDILAYIKASRGYRSGGHNLGAFSAAQYVPFGPEFVYEQEIGLKTEFFDRRVRVNLSAYHNLLEGAQRTAIRSFAGNTQTLVSNAASARNLGIEGDIQIRPARGLSLSASGSFNDSKYLDFSDAAGDRRSERFIFVPKYQFNLGAEYQTNLTSRISSRFNLDYSWIDSRATTECVASSTRLASMCYTTGPDINGRTIQQISADIVAATTLPAAGVLNGRITFGLADDAYTISIWGKNLLDDRSVVGSLYTPAPQRNYVSVQRREPVTYGVTASAKF